VCRQRRIIVSVATQTLQIVDAEEVTFPERSIGDRVRERAATTDIGAILVAEGKSVVLLNNDGALEHHYPNGTVTVLGDRVG
jgi:hypothetical protein